MTEIKNINIGNKFVVQANILIEASYKLSIYQQKFLEVMASLIGKTDEDFKKYEFKISELMELLDTKDQNSYKEFTKQTRALGGNLLTFRDGKKRIDIPFLIYTETDEGEGTLKVQFHPYLKPFYLYIGKENPYTKYRLKNILKLNGNYAIRIYKLLKQYEKIGFRNIKIDKLKELLSAEALYTKYNDFKRKVLLQAQKEINTKTDITFTFEEIKTGRKVTDIKFFIKAKETKTKKDEPTTVIPWQIDVEELAATDEVEQKELDIEKEELVKQVQAIFTEHSISKKEAECILKDAGNNLDLIKQCYFYLLGKNVKSVVGYMRNLVKNFAEPVPNATAKTGAKKTNKFLNFPQTKYNFEEIEKEMKQENVKKIEENRKNFEEEIKESIQKMRAKKA